MSFQLNFLSLPPKTMNLKTEPDALKCLNLDSSHKVRRGLVERREVD